MSFQTVSLVEYACKIWSFYLLRFKISGQGYFFFWTQNQNVFVKHWCPGSSKVQNCYFIYYICRGPWMSTVVLYCWCHSDSASFLLYFTFLSHLFPLPCGAGSTVPREGFDSIVIMPFFLVCCGCDTSYIVSVHIQCQASIYTLSLCRGH